MSNDEAALVEESAKATDMLRGKVVARVIRVRTSELLIEFDDGTRLFVDGGAQLELSIARGRPDSAEG